MRIEINGADLQYLIKYVYANLKEDVDMGQKQRLERILKEMAAQV